MDIHHYVKLSARLMRHVRWVYEMVLSEEINLNHTDNNTNIYTEHALSMYVLSVAAVEAFVNEVFLSEPARYSLITQEFAESLYEVGKEKFEGMNLKEKLVIFPQLWFGQTLPKDKSPYQDMALLIKIRNEIVHYKMNESSPNCFRDLEQRGISLAEKDTWPQNLSCLQGIKWAHNTACLTIRTLVDLVTIQNYKKSLEIIDLPAFELIP